MRIVWFDASYGCAGDMCLGALVDAGAAPARIAEMLAGLGIGREFDLAFEKVARGAIAATKAKVWVLGHGQGQGHGHGHGPERRLRDVLGLIDGAKLPDRVAERASAVFRVLAGAEAKVHGQGIDEVHFHEVGAVDAIVDVVGTCAALEVLGVDEV
ncbi:MAG TPA: nickel insertion protein, partial [Planctomycetota bacterium]|nr:nickel insertion protein [Planctomycetota bacterium]